EAIVIAADMAKYKRASEVIRSILRTATPIIEPLSLDEAYLDLTVERAGRAPPAVGLAALAARLAHEAGIAVAIGLSSTKFLRKLASELRKPRGFSPIGRAEAKAFLAPLSVRRIHGVGAVTARRMEESGLSTAGDLQGLSKAELTARFGKLGERLA